MGFANPRRLTRRGSSNSDSYSVNCTFINNTAEDRGGAIDGGSAVNCTFIGNCAYLGGAISNGFSAFTATATNCIFINNRATSTNPALFGYGGAMGQYTSLKVIAIECIFINNTADGEGDAMYSGEALNCTFIFNGISGTNAVDCEFPTPVLTASDFVSYLGSGDSLLFNLSHNGLLIKGFDTEIQISNDTFSDTFHALSGDDWPVNLALGVYSARLSLVGHPEVEIADATLTVLRKASLIINAPSTTYSYDDYAVAYLLDSETEMPIKGANLTVWINGGSEVYTTGADGGISVPTKNLAAGIHDFKVAFRTDAIHYKCEGIANLTVKKDASQLLASKVSTTFNVKKGLVITLKDSRGNPIIGADVSVSLDRVKTYKTDKNGQIRIDVHKLVPKTYNAKITFRENENYLTSSASTKVTVKKASSKMTAKSKTFKTKDKNKKYSVKLKGNVGKVIKKAKITLKVNGKTYMAKTNAKGVATFKLKKLKKGTFKAKIAFKGNKYYKNTSKRVKLTVK